MNRYLITIFERFFGRFTENQQFGLLLVVEALNKHRILFAGILVLGVVAAVFEGGTMGILALAVTVLVREDTVDLESHLGSIGAYADQLQSLFSKEEFFIILVIVAVIAQVLRSGSQYGAKATAILLQTNVMIDLQRKIIHFMMALSYEEISKHPPGELSGYIAQTGVVSSIVGSMNQVIGAVFTMGAYLGILMWMSFPMTMGVILIIIFLSLSLGGVVRKLREVGGRAARTDLVSAKRTIEYLQFPRLIRVFSIEDYAAKKMLIARENYLKFTQKGSLLQAIVEPVIEIITIVGGGLFLVIGYMVSGKDAATTVPILLTFLLVLNRMMPQVKVMNNLRASLNRIRPALGLVANFLRPEGKILQRADGVEFSGLSQSIDLKNVSFCYDNSETRTLSDINFSIKKGEMVAIVGASGSGKSTLISLLVGLNDIFDGAILIDGKDIKGICINDWRRQLGVVDQDSQLLSDSILENIRLGRPGASDEDIFSASGIAHADEFIRDMKNGYDTEVGSRGYKLSGGQKQRVALARAILRKPDILLLDEATSALDSISERKIQDSISQLRESNMTMIIVAHRLSTIKDADKIVVLDEGKVVEMGNHSDLIASKGAYWSMWSHQVAFPKSESESVEKEVESGNS